MEPYLIDEPVALSGPQIGPPYVAVTRDMLLRAQIKGKWLVLPYLDARAAEDACVLGHISGVREEDGSSPDDTLFTFYAQDNGGHKVVGYVCQPGGAQTRRVEFGEYY